MGWRRTKRKNKRKMSKRRMYRISNKAKPVIEKKSFKTK